MRGLQRVGEHALRDVDMIKLTGLQYQILGITNMADPDAAGETLNLATHGLGQVQRGAAR